jgi:hypothetical protein
MPVPIVGLSCRNVLQQCVAIPVAWHLARNTPTMVKRFRQFLMQYLFERRGLSRKFRVRRRSAIYLALVLLISGSLGGAKANQILQTSPHVSDCPEKHRSASSYPIHPQYVIVEPWKGRHNVYGIFVIPANHESDWLVTVTFKDGQRYCGQMNITDDDSALQPLGEGEYVMQGLLRTRTTLWLLSHGKKGELEQPKNWTLWIRDKASK